MEESERGHHIEGPRPARATDVNATYRLASKLLPLAQMDGSASRIDWVLYVNTGCQAADEFSKLVVQFGITSANPATNVNSTQKERSANSCPPHGIKG